MRLEIDSGGYLRSADSMAVANVDTFAALQGLVGGLAGSGAMAGTDDGGREWAGQYDAAARDLVLAGERMARGMGNVAYLLHMSTINHVLAEANSDLRGGTIELPPEPVVTDLCLAVPPSAAGGTGDLPGWLEVVWDHIQVLWPDADTGRMRAAATAWEQAGTALRPVGTSCDMAAASVQASTSPEIATARTSCTDLGGAAEELATAFDGMAAACREYADEVDRRHDEVKGLAIEMAWQTALIEAAGWALGAVTFGGGAAAGHAAALARIAALANRIREALAALKVVALAKAARFAALAGRAGALLTRVAKYVTAAVAKAVSTITRIGSPWKLDPSARGFRIEAMLGGNLPNTFKTFDKWDKATKTATSIKSMDLAAATYGKASAIYSRLKKYVDDVVNFSTETKQGQTLTKRMIKTREIILAIPKNGTPQQMAAIERARRYAKSHNIEFEVVIIR